MDTYFMYDGFTEIDVTKNDDGKVSIRMETDAPDSQVIHIYLSEDEVAKLIAVLQNKNENSG